MSGEPLLTSDQIITILLSLFSGITGSVATVFVTKLNEDKKEKETAKRVRALITAELVAIRNHLQHWLDASRDSPLDFVPLGSNSVEVQYFEKIINNSQYLALDTNTKLKAFNADELRELYSVYTKISTMHTFKTVGIGQSGAILFGGNNETFVYCKADLLRWLDALNHTVSILS